MYKKILVPTDGSPAARRAAEVAAAFAAPFGDAHVTIVIVVAPHKAEETDFDEAFVAAQNARMRRQAEIALETTASLFAKQATTFTTKVLEGEPVSAALAREAAAGGYDFIVMGSRGMGIQKDDLRYIGSVTEHVIRRVPIPVVVVPVEEA